MKEPQKIPLTDNPRTKQVQIIRLIPNQINKNWYNEDYNENNSESIQQLESYETD